MSPSLSPRQTESLFASPRTGSPSALIASDPVCETAGMAESTPSTTHR